MPPMSVSSALSTSARCSYCHIAALRSLLAFTGVELGPRSPERPPRWMNRRFLTTSTPSRSNPTSENADITSENLSPDPLPVQSVKYIPANKPQPAIPWYLQVQSQAKRDRERDSSHPLAERQRIPDLPENSPPILAELLEHVSVDIGLDDLSILDLRAMEPPPALGANLIMVFGTARSEKHVHVSGDRFCRWLRSQYKLRPFADGLLGRNELKLRQKRRAKRVRLMATAGAPDTTVEDDTKTGWVCVNIGRVDPAEGMEESEEQLEGIVGFGTRSNGVALVVQILMEGRREELNLEGLWKRMLNDNLKEQRRLRKRDEQSERNQQEVDEDEQEDDALSQMARLRGSEAGKYAPLLA
ncbi:hypothetical protein K402DRAFT_397811 [Aulographum hederae CBS 113979]|uniref:ATPase synthesis protein 25 n=1 Tax=Aulographum hederae CBS 113979 TaxID=1176131 RepID=A0A6G1GN27_9PEZI|nr:hypothetical protein K402DRAFT_397811 [Aulographum hederae CBS 113979]